MIFRISNFILVGAFAFGATAFADDFSDAKLGLSTAEAQAINKISNDENPALAQQERDNLQFANESFVVFIGRDCHSKALHNGANGSGAGLLENIAICMTAGINARTAEIKARYQL